jgi:hypothetical protein
MPKLGLWIDDELNAEIDRLHEVMLRKHLLRDLKLTKTDVIKMLIRRSLPSALVDQGELPKNMDPSELLEALDDIQRAERDALLRLRDKS